MAGLSAAQKAGIILVTVLCIGSVGFSSFILYKLKSEESGLHRKSIHLVIDKQLVADCPTPSKPLVPCLSAPNAFQTKKGTLGPLRCKDDYFDEEGGVNTCDMVSDTFHINSDRDAVVVQRPGVYRIYGQVSFKDPNDLPVMIGIHVKNKNVIQCHQQNRQPNSAGSSSSSSAPYTTCSVSAERRLRAGDRVGIFMPDNLRTINSYEKTTFWGMIRMSD